MCSCSMCFKNFTRTYLDALSWSKQICWQGPWVWGNSQQQDQNSANYTDLHSPLIVACINIYIYMVTPPPWSTYKHFIWELPVFYAHFCLPEKWHSHVSISFTYYVSRRPRHTHMQFCFCLLFCHFLRFWSKTQKTLRKPKKTKKTKLQDPCRYKLVS